jgi:hypothetical protein
VGLPDGIFSNQTIKFEQILVGLEIESAGRSYVHLVYLTCSWYILWPFGIFCDRLVLSGMSREDKSGSSARAAGKVGASAKEKLWSLKTYELRDGRITIILFLSRRPLLFPKLLLLAWPGLGRGGNHLPILYIAQGDQTSA